MRLVYACGAAHGPLKELPDFSHTKPDGRSRMLVYDSEASGYSPTMPDGTKAPCRFWCPCKRAAGRRQTRCYPSDESKAGKVPPRLVITCYATVER